MRIKGSVLLSRIAYIKETFGIQGVDAVLKSLSPQDQSILRGMILSANWYPFETGERLDKAIVQILGKGKEKIFEDIGAASAQQNLTADHRVFLDPGNPLGFLERADIIYKFYYDTGHREFESMGYGSGILTTYDAETYSHYDCLTVIGWYKHALKMCGAKNVQMVESTCRSDGGPFCRYKILWND